MDSTFWYNLCAAAYFAALFMLIFNLIVKKAKLRRAATLMTAFGFLSHAIGMVFRWHEAGLVEIASIERATDVKLEGIARFVAYTQHPPWSNLYEIMVFMAWGIIIVSLVTEVKWRIRIANIFSLGMALVALSLASLVDDGTLKPLVPALQSWWIMIHVISSAIGYAAGAMGAVFSLLYLLKARDKITLTAVASMNLALSAFLFLILGRGFELFKTASYRVKLLGYFDGQLEAVGKVVGGSFKVFYTPSPGVGVALIAAIVVSVAMSIYLWRVRKESDTPQGLGRIGFLLAFGLSTITIGLIILNGVIQTDVQLAEDIASKLTHGAPPPWRLHVTSNQWDLALFIIVWAGQFIVALAVLFPTQVRAELPDAARLDRGAYYTILLSFALVAVVLVTGALWAHYAWGRYWGWDPKETGALVIWLTYAIYLHARMTYGWGGVPAAVIGILGFFVIIAGFLGVNLGWFADGLHSYGSA
jgi:ABC-type transport system involved in cytochrome c biogenesis permease subunit